MYNKITLYGKQRCDYLYIQNDEPSGTDFTYIDDEPTSWNESTTLYANFNSKNLNAGNTAVIDCINGYDIYRRKLDEPYAEYVCTVDEFGNNTTNIFVDYGVKNNTDYIYILYPKTTVSYQGHPLSPLVTESVKTDCPYWSLFIVDESEKENVFYLDKMFKFELNLSEGDMSNNAQITVTPNFTKYPTTQFGNANYWSGSLSALCGFISCNDVDYIQTVNMVREIKGITSDTRRKFLKDIDGNLFEVEVSAPITINTENMTLQRLKTVNLSWVEVGDTKGISIINNPNKQMVDWVLTETGIALPYNTYVWGDQYIWNDSYIWTENDSVINTNTNSGREII